MFRLLVYEKPVLVIRFKLNLTTMEPKMIQLGVLGVIYRLEQKINFVFAGGFFAVSLWSLTNGKCPHSGRWKF